MDWVTVALVVVGIVALGVELVGLYGRLTNKSWGNLISLVMRQDGCRWLIIPFGWGVLAGHFFGPPWDELYCPELLAGVGVALLVDDLFVRAWRSKWWVFGLMLAGVLLGATLWSQG